LKKMAVQATNPQQRSNALRAIGMIGGDEAHDLLLEFYQQASDGLTRDSALHGMLISGHTQGLAELFRASEDASEKRRLLRMLSSMDSELALELIDQTLKE
ncbi:MAG: hypothetical protein AAGD86_10330, partial [Pseudomonadota bacterium]